MKNLSELSGTELVVVMNKVMAEVKSRLDEGTVTKYVAREIPSIGDGVRTVKLTSVSDLKKGDKVKFIGRPCDFNNDVINGKTYVVDRVNSDDERIILDEKNESYISEMYLHLFEKVVEAEIVVPIKSTNQQRAELIQRAREFVEENTRKESADKYFDKPYIELERINASALCVIDNFVVNSEKRTVVCILRGADSGEVLFRGIAKCMPGDVFNEWIGKAIALAKALKIDIPQEFIDAVQPDKVVAGMTLVWGIGSRYSVEKVDGNSYDFTNHLTGVETFGVHYDNVLSNSVIINDTFAEYDFESVGE